VAHHPRAQQTPDHIRPQLLRQFCGRRRIDDRLGRIVKGHRQGERLAAALAVDSRSDALVGHGIRFAAGWTVDVEGHVFPPTQLCEARSRRPFRRVNQIGQPAGASSDLDLSVSSRDMDQGRNERNRLYHHGAALKLWLCGVFLQT